jgi:hypothetical protein
MSFLRSATVAILPGCVLLTQLDAVVYQSLKRIYMLPFPKAQAHGTQQKPTRD